MVTLNNLKTLAVVILTLLFIIFVVSSGQSRSGANKVLRTNGEMTYTTIYDIDTLYFTPSTQILSEEVLRALKTEQRHYVVVLDGVVTTKAQPKNIGRKR